MISMCDNSSSPSSSSLSADDGTFVEVPDLTDETPPQVLLGPVIVEQDQQQQPHDVIQEEQLAPEVPPLQHPLDPLASSLHTTCSQESVCLEDLFPIQNVTSLDAPKNVESDKVDVEDDLSLHASEVDASDFVVQELDKDESATQPPKELTKEETTALPTLCTESQQPVREEGCVVEDKASSRKKEPFGYNKWILIVCLVGIVFGGIQYYCTLGANPFEESMEIVFDDLQLNEQNLTTRVEIELEQPEPVLEDDTETKPSSTEGWSMTSWQAIIVFALAKMVFGKSSPAKKDDTTVPVKEIPPAKTCSSPSFDLSVYEQCHVKELRGLLRERKCNSEGKKPKLIHRLTSVHASELQTLTVVQLRRKLKAKGLKQAGTKAELIEKLIAAGP